MTLVTPRRYPHHQRRAVRIDGHGPDIPAFVALDDVQVTERCPHDFLPSVYVDLGLPSRSENSEFLKLTRDAEGYNDTLADEKVYILQTAMVTQGDKPLLDPRVLKAIMTLRAKQANPEVLYAEAFVGRTILYTNLGA